MAAATDASCDAAVLCLVMCSLPDRAAALAEVVEGAALRGVLRFPEHTHDETPKLRAVRRVALPRCGLCWPAAAMPPPTRSASSARPSSSGGSDSPKRGPPAVIAARARH